MLVKGGAFERKCKKLLLWKITNKVHLLSYKLKYNNVPCYLEVIQKHYINTSACFITDHVYYCNNYILIHFDFCNLPIHVDLLQ